MSRCFPFPPPGYEKKARLEDTDLLTKEKHKEKKHKKDKKDKEKREGTERKKDKERSDRKNKERKDRKEKHNDGKDKDRDKEKKRSLDEKNIVGPLEGQNGEKLGSNCLQNGETTDSRFLLELGKRIRDEGGARENGIFQSITVTDQRSSELPGRVAGSGIGNSTEGKEKCKNKRKDNRNVNGQRNKIEAEGVGNAFVPDFNWMDQKRVGVAGPVEKNVKKHREEKEKPKHKDSDSRGDRHKDRDLEKKSKSKDKDRTKEKEKAKEKEPNKEQPPLKEISKDGTVIHNVKSSYLLNEGNKSSTYNGNLGKRKEREMNGFLHDDDIRPIKLPRAISSSHQLVDNGRKLEPCQTALQVACDRQAAATNHKEVGKVSSCHQIRQNGRKLEANPSAIQSAPERPGAANSCKTEKEARINGLTEAQQLNAFLSKPLSTPVRAKEKVEASAKRGKEKVEASAKRVKDKVEASAKLPHPDSKYLDQILSVPKVAEWSDFDDQEWLFSSDNLHAEKAKACSFEVDETLQVWAEALRIESADVTALPYVIPF